MVSLTENEIAVLRWYAHTSEPIADAFAGDVLESRIRLSRLGLVSQYYSTCDDRVAERASEAGLIVLALLDQVAELKRERDEAHDMVDLIRHSPIGGLLDAMCDPRCKTYAAHLAVTDAGEQWELQARQIVGPSVVSKLAADRDEIERLTRERDKALAKLEEEKRERARAGFSRGED